MKPHPTRAKPLVLSLLGVLCASAIALSADRALAQAPLDTTGPYPVVMEEDRSLPDHTIYRPTDLASLPPHSLPIVVFGEGGCQDAGNAFDRYLAEIASHGFLVIANGAEHPEAFGRPLKPGEKFPEFGKGTPIPHGPPSSVSQLIDAIGWAQAKADAPGPYHNVIDPTKVAVSGQSCGGLQALVAAGDPRVTTAVIFNSGIIRGGMKAPPGMPAIPAGAMPALPGSVADLQKLHAPMIYIIGGPSDIAYANANDDFQEITTVPVFQANTDTGHMGSFWDPHGGRFAEVASQWLLWRLKGDPAAASWFVGPNCRLCQSPAWTVRKKGMD